VTFNERCPRCDGPRVLAESPDDTSCVPLDPRFYPDFQYVSKGFFADLVHKKRDTAKLQLLMEAVLSKYRSFRSPYFVNFLHVTGAGTPDRAAIASGNDQGDGLSLFELVLKSLGFEEVETLAGLTERLLHSTEFSYLYSSFSEEAARHVRADLLRSLEHWIEESGSAFRRDLPLFLYLCWEKQLFTESIPFHPPQGSKREPLLTLEELQKIESMCEGIHLRIRVTRFRSLLERFDPSRYMTIFRVDALSGLEFEQFLADLMRSVGYDVQETKPSHDQGADLFVQRFGRRVVVQAKRYAENVGNAAVQQALAAKAHFACDGAMVMTNSYFTASAKELAQSVGVDLVDRDGLRDMLDTYNQLMIESSGGSDERQAPEAEVSLPESQSR